MKRLTAALVGVLILATAGISRGADHAGHGAHGVGNVAHQEVVDGVKATFTIQTMAEAMREMGMELPKGVKETHHLSVSFTDVKSGRQLTDGSAAVKLQYPDGSTVTKELSGMKGHFGADLEMAKEGRYGVMSRFILADGKTRQVRFWYTVKKGVRR